MQNCPFRSQETKPEWDAIQLMHAQMVKTNDDYEDLQPSLKRPLNWHTNPFKFTRKRALNEKMPGDDVKYQAISV